MLNVKNLTKTYGEKKAVDDLSLHILPGEVYGFIGHNGAGKTTTLKAVSGILDFEDGEILIDGENIAETPISCKQKLAYIPDNPDLYDFMTGLQYLNFVADIYGVSVKERKERIKKYSEMFGIFGDLSSLVGTYSHGMKQKLALISALIHKPKLWILDEPFVGLDPKASIMLKQIMKESCKEGGAVFFSTHVLEVAEKLCNKVAVIKDGSVIASGAMQDVVKEAGSLEALFMEVQGSETN